MPSPLERLERAYADVMEASGPIFFRRLREYQNLLEDDRAIRRAVNRLKAEVERAQREYEKMDEGIAEDLAVLRNELVELAPEADDSDATRPGRYDPADSAAVRELDAWTWTLANFDAVVADRQDKVIRRDGLDNSKSRMLGEILNAKLHNLIFPGDPNRPVRKDLDSLYSALGSVRARQTSAQHQFEEVAESAGYLALISVEHVVSYLDPREARSMDTEDETLRAVNAIFAEVASGFHHLREAVRPEEARGPLDPETEFAVERQAAESRGDLKRLHRPLRQSLENGHRVPRWSDLSRGEKLTVIGIAVAVAVGVITLFVA